MEQDRNDQDEQNDAKPLEWAVAAISAIIVAGLIGFLLLEALNASGGAPASASDPVAEVVRVTQISNGFRVEINARNKGEATAASVKFRASLRHDGKTAETADVTFDYLPGQSARRGAVIFEKDPRLYEMVIRAESYTAP